MSKRKKVLQLALLALLALALVGCVGVAQKVEVHTDEVATAERVAPQMVMAFGLVAGGICGTLLGILAIIVVLLVRMYTHAAEQQDLDAYQKKAGGW